MWWRLRTLAGLCCGRQVGLDGCLFALRLTDREALPLVSRRLGALEAFYDLDAPIARVTAYDVPYPASPFEGWYLPSVERVVAAAHKTASQ